MIKIWNSDLYLFLFCMGSGTLLAITLGYLLPDPNRATITERKGKRNVA